MKKNDKGKDDFKFVYDVHGEYKIKWNVLFRSENETNCNEMMPLVHLNCHHERYKKQNFVYIH
jgi:hypothetical protein